MDDWFDSIAADSALSTVAVHDLHNKSFVVISGPVPPEGLMHLTALPASSS
jgi:hypothetical protein